MVSGVHHDSDSAPVGFSSVTSQGMYGANCTCAGIHIKLLMTRQRSLWRCARLLSESYWVVHPVLAIITTIKRAPGPGSHQSEFRDSALLRVRTSSYAETSLLLPDICYADPSSFMLPATLWGRLMTCMTSLAAG